MIQQNTKVGSPCSLHSQVGHNIRYSVKHDVAEWICLVVCFLQIKLTDFFLDGNFTEFGPKVNQTANFPKNLKTNPKVLESLSQDVFDRNDPMGRVFPIVTTCEIKSVRFRRIFVCFHFLSQFGTAGGEKLTPALCVLPNNIVHQKFYLFLWFWLFAITIVTLLHQLYRSTFLLAENLFYCSVFHL